MSSSCKLLKKISSRNKRIARKIASKVGLKYKLASFGTGSIYLYISYQTSTKYTSCKQVIVRVSNHYGIDPQRFDLDVIVFNSENPEEFIQGAVDDVIDFVSKDGGIVKCNAK